MGHEMGVVSLLISPATRVSKMHHHESRDGGKKRARNGRDNTEVDWGIKHRAVPTSKDGKAITKIKHRWNRALFGLGRFVALVNSNKLWPLIMMSNKVSLQNQLQNPALVTLKNLMRPLTTRLEDGYCSITTANYRLITVIKFVAKSYTYSWKNFTNRLYLIFHTQTRRDVLKS